MQTWEYATVPLIVHATKQILDQWGEDGWELVAITAINFKTGATDHIGMVFKRPRG
jgi:hypothetical protein